MSKSLMPSNFRCMKNKWALKIKHNSVYWAHLVVCRYCQAPVVNFLDDYSPVVNDVTLCVLLLMVLHFGYLAKIDSLETAFLYGDLEEEIYMECPQGMSNIKMMTASFSTSESKYYKKNIEILKSSRFVRGSINPCLFVKKSAKGIVCVALYIDNNLMVGDIATIDNAIEALKNKGLVLKIVEELHNYLSCEFKFSTIRRVPS